MVVYIERGISTVEFLVPTGIDQLIFILKIELYSCYKTSYLIQEVSGTEPSR
jgi:hypothetical protein